MLMATTTSELATARPVSLTIPLQWLAPVAVCAALVVLSLVSLDYPATTFRSPDELASFVFTRAVAETGRPYYSNDLTAADRENLMHERGALTHEGKVVPFNDLGLPVVYGAAYRLLGDDIRYVAIPLEIATAIALASAGGIIVGGGRRWLAWLAVLGLMPVFYYLNRPLTNAAPAITFFSVGVYFLVRYFYLRRPSALAVIPIGLSFSIAAFMRYEWAIFAGLLVLLVLLHKHGREWLRVLPPLFLFGVMLIVLFVQPVLALNKITYGSPLTFGYALFHEAYFPDRAAATSGSLAFRALDFVRYILWPSNTWDFTLAIRSFLFQVVGVAPILVLAAVFGAFALVRRSGGRLLPFAGYAALGAYFYLYYATSASWLAGSSTPNLEASVVRYSLPLYVGFFFLVCFGLANVDRNDVTALLAGILIVASLQGGLDHVDGNLLYVRNQVRLGDQQVKTTVLPVIEPDAIVYTDVFDKTLGPYRTVATWLGGERALEQGYFRPADIATSMDRVYGSRPVYFYTPYSDQLAQALQPALVPFRLKLTGTQVRHLFRVDRSPGADGR
jgi:hypothetical protein